MTEALLGVVLFTAIVMALVLVILAVRSRLVPAGEVEILVNEDRSFRAPAGVRLSEALSAGGVHLPSGCAGKGTCGLCRVNVVSGGGPVLPVEADLFPRREVAGGARLACQVTLRDRIEVRVPESILGARELRCRVRSNRNVATFIKELVLELPAGEELAFRAGAFVQLKCPPFHARFADFDVEPEYRDEWDRHGLWRLEASADRGVTRAYSLANYPGEVRPGESRVVVLNVRIATPPPGSEPSVPPGVVSSYVFQLAPGDEVAIAGPFGHFFAAESDAEMVFVGGGAGMAPMRSHVFDQLERLHTERTLSFWYGARNLRELFYAEDFERLAAEHPNFRWTAALSEPKPEDEWTGEVGFVHEVLRERYLAEHPAPEECEYYLCGPPLMIQATRRMLDELGVETERIHFDDFGG